MTSHRVAQTMPVVDGVAVDAEAPKPAVPVVVAAENATGKVAQSPPECSGAPPPTEGRVPAVPVRYWAPTERVLTKRNLWICWWNVAAVVLLLLNVWFNILVEHDVLTGTLLPTPSPPPPPLPPQAPTTCPFDVVACNRRCALMWVDCKEYNRNRPTNAKGKKVGEWRNCDRLHGNATWNATWNLSTVNFDTVGERTVYLESLDWEHEPNLWGIRKENVGDGHCDRTGCGETLCECNFDGGDCLREEDPARPGDEIIGPMVLSILIYVCTMCVVLNKVIGYHLKVPKLRDEGELTAYVTKMQRAQLQLSFSVVCSHVKTKTPSKVSGFQNGSNRKVTVVTHRSSHPFTYVTSTDASTLTKSWQQPAEDGSLGTGFLAVVSSGLSWSVAKGVTADKLKAEKKRLHEENKHRDARCSVTVKATLPGQLSTQLYAPADAKFTKRLSPVAELLLVSLGLGAPLYFYYVRRLLRRHIQHTVRKTIYIEPGSAAHGHLSMAQGLTLKELSEQLAQELKLTGTIADTIDQACIQLGVPPSDSNLIEKARVCHAALFGVGGSGPAGHFR